MNLHRLDSPVVQEDLDRLAALDLPWERLDGRRVLVTGAAGMIPALLTEALLGLAPRRSVRVHVTALGRSRRTLAARLGHLQERQSLSLLVQDVCAPLPEGLQADLVVHGASPAQPRQFARRPVETLLPNTVGTQRLLDRGKDGSLQAFLFLSSSESYGAVKGEAPLRETDAGRLDPQRLRDCYGLAKRTGEALCRAYASEYDVPAVSARIFHTYGPGLRLDDERIFASLVRDLLAGGPVRLQTAGRAQRSFCYLADTVAALLRLLLTGAAGETYNVGHPREVWIIRDLAERLARERGTTVRAPANEEASPPSIIRPDCTRLQALGWQPCVDIDEGFGRTLAAYGEPS